MTQKALIYCRVSTRRQSTQGSGLTSQEQRCRLHAETNGYEVEAVFPDDFTGSGNFMNRPGMVAMLEHINQHPTQRYVVIFDDLKRLARDTKYYLLLREMLDTLQVKVECLNFNFEATPEGEFYETVIAAGGQLERKQNARQTHQKVTARFEAGYWGLKAPLGYKMQSAKGQPRILVRDEPIASYIEEALKGYACGRFQSQNEVRLFLESCPDFPRTKHQGRNVHPDLVKRLLTNTVYAGMVELKIRNISLREGQHEGLIDMTTFHKIQERLKGRANAPDRKDLNEDFALRGAVLCGDCGAPYTANWSKGRTKHHPYYLCRNKGCKSYGKSIRRQVLEEDFETLLKSLHPAHELTHVAFKMFKSLWEQMDARRHSNKQILQKQLKALDADKDKLIDKLMTTSIDSVITAYEQRIEKIEHDKLVLAEKIKNEGKKKGDFNKTFRTALQFLSNPYQLWHSQHYRHKRALLKLVLCEPITYDKNKGFRTAAIARPFRAVRQYGGCESRMAVREGFEPSIRCRIHTFQACSFSHSDTSPKQF